MKKLAREKHNLKNIDESLALLTQLHQTQEVEIIKKEDVVVNVAAILIKNETKEFALKYDSPDHNYNLRDIKNLEIKTGNYIVCIDELFVTYVSPPEMQGNVWGFHTRGFDKQKESYFRLIIPLKKEASFSCTIDEIGYETETHWFRNCIRTHIDGLHFDIYQYNERKEALHYLILDSPGCYTFESFSDYCFSILVSFGYKYLDRFI
jgi:hypothetical protein